MPVPEFLVLDVYYDIDAPAKPNTVIQALKPSLGDACYIESVHEMNFVLKGQARSRSGSRSGLRLMLAVVDQSFEQLEKLVSTLLSKPIEGVQAERFIDAASSLRYPTSLSTSKAFGEHGHVMFCVGFTDGAGSHGATAVKNAKSEQARDTKNALNFVENPCRHFPPAADGVFSSDRFYLTLNQSNPKGGSIGAAYQFQYDLERMVQDILERSEGVWWGEAMTTSSSTRFDTRLATGQELSGYDPSEWYHRTGFRKGLNGELELLDAGDLENKKQASAFHYERRRGLMAEYEYDRIIRFVDRLEGSEPFSVVLPASEANLHDLKSTLRSYVSAWCVREWLDMLHAVLLTYKPRIWGMSSMRIYHITPFV